MTKALIFKSAVDVILGILECRQHILQRVLGRWCDSA